jgi:hypothetical protein
MSPEQAPADLPTQSEFPTERARIVAIPDRQSRVWQANKVIGALITAHRFDEAEDLLARVLKSLRGPDSSLPNYLAETSARAFGAAREWPGWSRSLAAAGYEKRLAAARTTTDAENDPTDFAVVEPLSQGVPPQQLLPWIARAKDPAFRDTLVMLMVEAAFDRGRVASWKSDIDGFRRHVVEATARGEMLRRDPENPFDAVDATLLGFCRDEASGRGDRGLALVAALQTILKPPSEDTAFERDRFRERVMDALISALLIGEK